MTERDRQKLVGVHPQLVEKVEKILAALEALGFPMMVTDGVRSVEQQKALYAKGRTAPGPVVTYADGVEKRSNHQPRIDRLGHAVDCVFLVDGKPSWSVELPWAAYGALGEALGLKWGGKFTMVDCPHLEWPS